MLGSYLSQPQMPYDSSIVPSIFVDRAPRDLIAKTKSNQSQGHKLTLFKSPTFLPHV